MNLLAPRRAFRHKEHLLAVQHLRLPTRHRCTVIANVHTPILPFAHDAVTLLFAYISRETVERGAQLIFPPVFPDLAQSVPMTRMRRKPRVLIPRHAVRDTVVHLVGDVGEKLSVAPEFIMIEFRRHFRTP